MLRRSFIRRYGSVGVPPPAIPILAALLVMARPRTSLLIAEGLLHIRPNYYYHPMFGYVAPPPIIC